MKFAYWSREVAGWVLVVIGLISFYNAYALLMNKRIFEAAPLTFIGFIVFRGGIHVLKVAVAAQAAIALPEVSRPTTRRAPRATAHPIGPTPPKSVLPGPKTPRAAVHGRK